MRRFALAILLVSSLSGCSLAAAALGASPTDVRDLAKVDAQVVGGLLSSAAEGALTARATAGGDDGPSTDARTFMCWVDADGGEELRADSPEAASASCEEAHGERVDPRHCQCMPALAMLTAGAP